MNILSVLIVLVGALIAIGIGVLSVMVLLDNRRNRSLEELAATEVLKLKVQASLRYTSLYGVEFIKAQVLRALGEPCPHDPGEYEVYHIDAEEEYHSICDYCDTPIYANYFAAEDPPTRGSWHEYEDYE